MHKFQLPHKMQQFLLLIAKYQSLFRNISQEVINYKIQSCQIKKSRNKLNYFRCERDIQTFIFDVDRDISSSCPF